MKNARKANKKAAKAGGQENVTVSVSMPRELAARVKTRIQREPDLDFSKYARRLMREDLAKA